MQNPISIKSGLIEPSRETNRPFPTRIKCQYLNHHYSLFDIPPWGIRVPEIGAIEEGVFYRFEMETLYMPAETVVHIRWIPNNGAPHTMDLTLPGDGEINTSVLIPNEWVREAAGMDVSLEFEASYPDGTVEAGYSFDIHITRDLKFGRIRYEDMENGGTLDPSKYPDGIRLTIDPIENIEVYNYFEVNWQVVGFHSNGVSLLKSWETDFFGEPGKTYKFVIPPEYYTDLTEPAYTHFAVWASITVRLAPLPTPHLGWGFGGHTFALVDPARK